MKNPKSVRPYLIKDLGKRCKHEKKAYSERYDAHYCPKCLFWLEHICPDRNCEYCNKRPRYPKKNQP